MTKPREAVLCLFRVGHNRAAMFEPKDAIFPGQRAPVVRQAEDGERELVELSWGFVLLREGYAPKRVTNARDDKLLTRFWRTSFEGRRCLVPAMAFCEPHDDHKPTTWHWFALKGDEPRPLFAFAGLWHHWIGPIKRDSVRRA
jgi:putative SOS response-associated peptidase YedK